MHSVVQLKNPAWTWNPAMAPPFCSETNGPRAYELSLGRPRKGASDHPTLQKGQLAVSNPNRPGAPAGQLR